MNAGGFNANQTHLRGQNIDNALPIVFLIGININAKCEEYELRRLSTHQFIQTRS